MTDGGYDTGYRSCRCFWGTEPGSLVMKLSQVITSFVGLDVLDVGCGEGKNAMFFAARGAVVRAVDISEIAIDHARELASASRVYDILFDVKDARDLGLSPNQFDVVVAYGLFHCLGERDEISSVCTRLQSATRTGGYFILCAFNSRRQDLTAHPGFAPTILAHDDYAAMFSGWEILECTDKDLTEIHPNNGIQHTHSMTRILAKKLT
jgi:cyclopropane fatty-acyl-phospholipid synthase-like methyltransferase